jgi:hypothetical protein
LHESTRITIGKCAMYQPGGSARLRQNAAKKFPRGTLTGA